MNRAPSASPLPAPLATARATLLLGVALATGCASNPPTGPVYDPLENANRRVYAFNTALDNAVLKPVAKGYRFVVPDPLENGIDNFFNNLAEPGIVVNDLLQGKFVQAASDTGRFLVNSTVGVLGFFDVGSRIGLEKHRESLGQTLGVWGVGEGPFLMTPLFGPYNARAFSGFVVESVYTSLPPYIAEGADLTGSEETAAVLGLGALDLVSTRAQLLSAGNLLDSAALDPYLLFRDFWVTQHRKLTWDGERDVRIGEPDYGDEDDGDELDELDRLDALDAATTGGSEPIEEAVDDVTDAVEPDELDELDRLDELE